MFGPLGMLFFFSWLKDLLAWAFFRKEEEEWEEDEDVEQVFDFLSPSEENDW